MSSDSESDEFEGFPRAELDEAEARFQQQLLLQGIGDDSDDLESDEESDTDVPGPAGDAGNTDGWHDDFLYFERGLPHLFSPTGRTGPTRVMSHDKTPLDFFTLFFNHVLLEMLIEQTDLYAKLQKENKPEENKMAWVRPTIQEMNAFFGLCFEMGIDRKPSTRMYWSTDSFLQSPLHSKTMSRDRFTQIMRYLHFSDSTQQPLPGDPNYDPLYKVKPLQTHFNTAFKQEYTPNRNITVDETMIPFKGRVQFKQYMPAKPHKWGVKAWVLADSQNSYIQYVDIYPGKNATPQTHLGSSVVKRCLQQSDLVGKGYHLYTDNFFTSPELFSALHDNFGTYACGTVRINRRGLPKDIMCKKPTGINERGDMKFRQKGPLVASVWRDKKIVNILSTIHDHSISQVKRRVNINGTFSRQNVDCPKAVADYTCNMGGVDHADQYIQYYCYNHKTYKWTKRVFFVLMEMAKFNAFKLFSLSTNNQTSMTFLDFSISVAKGLVNGYTSETRRGRPSLMPMENRLVQRHMPYSFDKKSRCHLCYMRSQNSREVPIKQTKFGCFDCGKHLCLMFL